jgi:outer membrane protein
MWKKNDRGLGRRFSMKNLYTYSLLFIGFMFIMPGCRNVDAPSVPYAQWSPPRKTDNTSSDKVWSEIRHRQIKSQEPLTLAELLDIAFINSPVSSRAWQEIKSKQAVLGQKKSDLFPRITIGADGNREKIVSNIGQSGNSNQLRYGPSGNAELLIFDFGGRDASIEAAYQELLSSGFRFNRVLQDLILDVHTKYYELFSAYSRLEAAQADVINAEQTLDAAQIRFQAGIVSKLDQLQAEADYNNALYDLEHTKGLLEKSKAELAASIGLSADTFFSIAKPLDGLPLDIQESDIRVMIDQALMERPDIAAARASLKQKQELVKEASSALWPTVKLGASYDHDWYKYYNGNQARDNAYSYGGYLSFDWDIFDGFYNINKRDQAQAELQAEMDNLAELELQASADVWISFNNYKTAVKKLKFSKAFLESAMASHELALDGYSEGLKSMLDLLQAQSALSSARFKLVDSEKTVLVAAKEMAHATGSLSID